MTLGDHRLRDTATAHAAATLRLVDILRAARGAQWEPPTARKLVTPTGVLDPTGEAATATTGLALRARIDDALTRLELASDDFCRVASDLEELLLIHTDPPARHAAFLAARADVATGEANLRL